MKTDGYIFKENLSSLYVFFGIILSFFVGLWISNEAFPFGNKFAILLLIVIIIYLILLAIPIWCNIKHPKLLIIDETGIHHYNRRFTLSSNSTLWIDDYMFYSWDNVQEFYFEWTGSVSRQIMPHRYLVLEQEQDKATFIRISEFYGKKHKYVDAIEECSGGKCVLNRAKYDENIKARNRLLWETGLIPTLIGVALAVLLIKLGVR